MAFTLDTNTINKHYQVYLTQRDFNLEKGRKATKLYNAGNASNVQSLYAGYEGLSQAGIIRASANISVDVSGFNTEVDVTLGLNAKISDVLILGFRRVHPLSTTGRIIKAYFGIIAPHNDVVSDGSVIPIGKPVMVRGVAFAEPPAGRTEMLGAMVDFLEDALTFTAVDDTTYNGGWTYDPALSGLISKPRIVGGSEVD